MVLLVMVAMNLIYAMSAYPFGKLSDRMSHTKLLALGQVPPTWDNYLDARRQHYRFRLP